mmetsp:Transcript_43795/g.93751  ORF Transcript_43795/g.93751 Transcript_43795/m.93751 type:complete len:650 (+) Transcript_43795:62-2011(+)
MDDLEMDEEELTAFLEAQQAAENLSFAAGGEEGELVLEDDEEVDLEAAAASTTDPAAAWTLDFDEDEDEFDKGDESKLQGWDEGEEACEDAYFEGGEGEAFYEDVDGAAEEDEFAEYDANELAAEALEAELGGDTELHAKLLAEIERRKSSGETVNSGSSGSSKRVEETFEVPLNAVGWVIGRGGERIKQIAADSGAKLALARDDNDDPSARTRLCKVRGSEDQVAKAKGMLAAAVAEAQGASKGKKGKGKGRDSFGFGKGGKAFDKVGEGAAGQEEGICKWFAAGFCRNRCFNGACRNGLHSSEAARKAEEEWVALAPEPGSQELLADSKLPLLLLLDLEGGGNRDGTDGEDEIIEVPILAMCPESGRELGRFHRFARPGFWDREALSMQQRFHPDSFNRNSSAVPFPALIVQMQSFICKVLQIPSIDRLQKDSFLFVTCGNWDVKTAIPLQCNKPTAGTVPFETQKTLFNRWSNLKDVFREHYRLDPSRAPTGMRGMLNRLKIPLQGQHHLGMDDVSNLAKIMKRMISEGCRFEGPTGTSDPTKMAGKAGGKSHGKGKLGKVGHFQKGGLAPAFGQPFVGKGSGGKGFDTGTDFKGKGKGAFNKGGKGTATLVPPKFGSGLPPPKRSDDALGEAEEERAAKRRKGCF